MVQMLLPLPIDLDLSIYLPTYLPTPELGALVGRTVGAPAPVLPAVMGGCVGADSQPVVEPASARCAPAEQPFVAGSAPGSGPA